MICLTGKWDFRIRLADRLREGQRGIPMVERETVKRGGDLVISANRVETISEGLRR